MKAHIDWISFYKFEIFIFLAVLNGIFVVTEKTLLATLDVVGMSASLYLAKKYLDEC